MDKFEDQHRKYMEHATLREKNINVHTSASFGSFDTNIDSLSSMARKIKDGYKFNNNPVHALLAIWNKDSRASSGMKRINGILKHEIRCVPERDMTKMNNKKQIWLISYLGITNNK